MRIKFQGEDLGEWKGAPRLKEARLVKQKLGLLPQQFAEAVSEMDPDAMSMMVSLLYTRAGKQVALEDIDGEFTDFDIELTDEEKRQAAEVETANLSPVISGILKELGVDVDAADVTAVVQKHVEEAQRKVDEGKEKGPSLT
jgi:hypothetical protein